MSVPQFGRRAAGSAQPALGETNNDCLINLTDLALLLSALN